MRCCGVGMGGWVVGWVEDEEGLGTYLLLVQKGGGERVWSSPQRGEGKRKRNKG